VRGAPEPHWRARRLGKPVPSFIIEDEIVTREERKVLPYYHEIARPGDREWWAAVGFQVGDRRWSLSMFRNTRSGPFGLSEAGHFLRVAPDLRRIISTAEKAWDMSSASSLAILDRLNCAAALLDCHGRITRFNQHAEALFGSDLMLQHGHLHSADRASDVRLQALIRSVVVDAPGGAAADDPVVVFRNRAPWFLAEAVPMTSFIHDLFNGGDALLHFTVLTREEVPSDRLLRGVFQLTAAEARLASALAGGEGLDAASAKLAITRETARTQLKAIFAKTGARRQAELAALLARLHQRSR
jgi:DNA-binding CsgD family transcriptional regulator